MKVFASMSCYALGWAIGPQMATQVVTKAITTKTPDQDNPANLLGALTIRTLRDRADVQLRIDTGASHLAKSRSRHFAAALESDCDAWVTVDDDVAVDPEAVATLLACVSIVETPRLVLVPCPLRGDPGRVNVEFTTLHVVNPIALMAIGGEGTGFLRRAVRGGFGCVAMNRAAMVAVDKASPRFRDVDGKSKPAAFAEILEGADAKGAPGKWHGEDLSFFERVPESVERWAVVCGLVRHAEFQLELRQLRGSFL